MHEDLDQAHLDGCVPKSKAEWRRANSLRAVAGAKASKLRAIAAAHRRGRRNTVGAAASHAAHAGGLGAARGRSRCEAAARRPGCGKAEWHEVLPDWFRITLNEQLEVARATFCIDYHDEDWIGTCAAPGEEEHPDVHLVVESNDIPAGIEHSGGDPAIHSAAAVAEEDAAGALEPANVGSNSFPMHPVEPADVGVPMLDQKARAGALAPSSASPKKQDAAIQCFPEDMLVPMYKMRVHQRAALRKLGSAPEEDSDIPLSERYEEAAPLCQDQPYTVALHFSLYEDASVVAARAAALGLDELESLAGRFLGSSPRTAEDARRAVWIGGVEVQRRNTRQPRRVPERHVLEAALLRKSDPRFGAKLLAGARGVLLRGLAEQPLCGRSLLTLALWDPPQWARLAHTALDFAARLLLAGALPRAFAAELLAGLAGLPQAEEACRMLVLGLVTVLPATGRMTGHCHAAHRRSEAAMPLVGQSIGEARPPPLARSDSGPVRPCPAPAAGLLWKTRSAPAELGPRRRSAGTFVRPHEHDAAHSAPCRVSFRTAGGLLAPCCGRRGGDLAEVIPAAIAARDLPAYWREAAGGALSPAELERRAAEAEEELRRQEGLEDVESEESDESGDVNTPLSRTTSCFLTPEGVKDSPGQLLD